MSEFIISDGDLKKLRLLAAHPEIFRGNPGGSVLLSSELFVKIVNTIDHFMAQNTALENRLAQLETEYTLLKIKKRLKVDSDLRFRLKELRISRRWSRQTLSQEIGISEAKLKNWELGYALPTLEELETLAQAFGLQDDALKRYYAHKQRDLNMKSLCTEIDTGDEFIFNGTAWVPEIFKATINGSFSEPNNNLNRCNCDSKWDV